VCIDTRFASGSLKVDVNAVYANGICGPASTPTTAGSCYALSTTASTWHEAAAAAVLHGGLLASISSASENGLLTSTYAGLGTNELWIGLNDEAVQDTWLWTDDSPSPPGSSTPGSGFNGWDGQQPNNGPERCAAFERSIQAWHDYPCISPFRAIVEWPLTGPAALSGLRVFGGHRYARTSVPMSWTHASALAAMLGARLVTIDDAGEQAFLTAQYANPVETFWIGLNDRATEGSFRWPDGSAPAYTAWAAGEPNGTLNDENCVHLRPSTGLWNDVQCHQPFAGAAVPAYALFEWDGLR
jgi:hypothetical protein